MWERKKAKSKTIDSELYIEQCIKVHSGFYKYTKTVYTKNYNKFIVTCPIHGDFSITANDHKQGRGCSNCGKLKSIEARKIKHNEFIKSCNKTHLNKYDYVNTVYNGCREPIIIICPKHGEFEQIAYYHKQGNGCPRCNESKGEMIIANTLDYIGVKYIKEWGELLNPETGRPLLFDFFIVEYSHVIEFDGIQHFKPITFNSRSNGIENLRNTKERDDLKNRLCKESGITIKRIPYTKINDIEKIIHEEIRRLQKQATNQ